MTSCPFLDFGRLDRAPHALAGGWQFDVRYPELGKRINDCVDHCCECRGRTSLTGGTNTEAISGGGHLAQLRFERGEIVSAWYRVIHEACGQ
jgi:hypothetical protein